MRLAIRLLVILAVAATGQMGAFITGHSPMVSAATVQSESAPKVLNVRRDGKRLLVTGEGFRMGAAIMVNGERQKTRNDDDNPTSLLIAKKAGKRLPANAVVSIEVANSDGPKSDPFPFFNGITVTLDDVGKPIRLSVGQRFLLLLKLEAYDFTTTIQDESILKKITDIVILPAAQGVFEAQRRGETRLTVVADPKCLKVTPPCMLASRFYEFTVIVE